MCPPVCANMQRQLQNSSKRCCHGSKLTDGACRVGLYAEYRKLARVSHTTSLLSRKHYAHFHGLTLTDAATPAHLPQEVLCHACIGGLNSKMQSHSAFTFKRKRCATSMVSTERLSESSSRRLLLPDGRDPEF